MHTRVQLRLPDRAVGGRPAARGHRRDARRARARWARPPTWVLSSHDETRHVTRFGRAYTGAGFGGAAVPGAPADLELGLRRARAAALLMLALPGLGVPLPGRGARPAGGGGPARGGAAGPDLGALRAHRPRPRRLPGAAAVGGRPAAVRLHRRRRRPWLPQPPGWAALTVAAQQADPASTLALYRAALHLRRSLADLRRPPRSPGDPRRRRRPRLRPRAGVPLRRQPLGRGRCRSRATVLLASGPCAGALPPDTAAWLSRPGAG